MNSWESFNEMPQQDRSLVLTQERFHYHPSLPPPHLGHLAMSGDTSGCHTREHGPGIQWLETRVASKGPTMCRTALSHKSLDKKGIALTVSGQRIFRGNALWKTYTDTCVVSPPLLQIVQVWEFLGMNPRGARSSLTRGLVTLGCLTYSQHLV